MLMLIIITWGQDMLIQQTRSVQYVRDLKQRLGGDREYIIYDSVFLFPLRLDLAWRQLAEDEVIEYVHGEAYPALEAEGRLVRKHGKYRKPVMTNEM